MKLFIDNIEVEFKELKLENHIGECSKLIGKIKWLTTNPFIFANIVLKNNYNVEIFEGKVISISQGLSNWFSFNALENSWVLRGKDANMHFYYGWHINDIFIGKKDTDITNLTNEVDYISVYAESSSDIGKYAIINGQVGGVHVTEKIKITSSATDIKSVWDKTKDKISGWNSIYSVHLADDTGKVVTPAANVHIRDPDLNIICTLDATHLYAALSDDNSHHANGLLYNTPFTVDINIDQDLYDQGKWSATGNSILDILKELCTCSVSYWDEIIPYFSNVLFKDNIIHITGQNGSKKSLRFDKEILNVERIVDMSNLTNKIYGESDIGTYIKESDLSISEYGEFITTSNLNYTQYESEIWAKSEIESRSQPSEEIIIESRIDIDVNDRVRVIIPHLNVDDEYIVQDTKKVIGQNNIVDVTATLSKNYIRPLSVYDPDVYALLKNLTRTNSFVIPRRY